MPDEPLHNEKQLFALIAEGDEKAFKTLYYQFLPRLQPLIAAIIRSDDHVKDLIQEVFLRIWLNRKDLPEIRDPKAWIFQITYFQSYTWLRRLAVKKKAAVKLHAGQESLQDTNPVADYITVQEIGRLVRESISTLSPQAQRIYKLSREQHLKIPEIAAQLGISPNTVKNTLVRSLKKISESLKEKGVFLPTLLLLYYLA